MSTRDFVGVIGGQSRLLMQWTMLPLLLLAACGEPVAGGTDDAVTTQLPAATEAAPSPRQGAKAVELPASQAITDVGPIRIEESPPPAKLASSSYTSLDPASCTAVADDGQGATATRRRCAGSVDFALETSESGGQPGLAIIAPDGERAELDVAKRIANARLGKTAEWRRDGSGRPRALIVRVDAAPATAATASVSDLVVTRLAAPACIVAVVPKGPRQNEKARAIADGARLECLKK